MTQLANVFEDQTGIRREGWLRRLTQLERVREGGFLPDGYGVAWFQPDTGEMILAPMPWHRLLGLAYRLYWRWRTRIGPGPLQAAYLAGVEAERTTQARILAATRRMHEDQLTAARAQGEQRALTLIRSALSDELRH